MRRVHMVGLILAAFAILALPVRSSAQIGVGIAVHIGPPALPVYAQPICPAPGYLWTPGYWAYGPDGYYWVPGTWVEPPEVGLLWTPGYWGWGTGGYFWHTGYWGPHVGFYGGINYGFGYGGVGFFGGRWDHGVFAYNTAVMHVNTEVIHNTYVDRSVIRNETASRVSFNGGRGGITARPTHGELQAEHEHHVGATSVQTAHRHAASENPALRDSVNHGRPAVAATARPGEFSGHGVVAAGASRNRPTSRGNEHANVAAESHRGNRPTSAGNEHRSTTAQSSRNDRPPAHNASSESSRNDRPTARNASSVSRTPREKETARSAPKSQPHTQSKPQHESKPKAEAQPHSQAKPHSEAKPHPEAKPHSEDKPHKA
ncbi:MAG: hypothetical protein WA765_15025 [Candidatus Acidiferrum sp.]